MKELIGNRSSIKNGADNGGRPLSHVDVVRAVGDNAVLSRTGPMCRLDREVFPALVGQRGGATVN